MQPDLVAGLEVGHAGDGQHDAGASDSDVDFGPRQVETASRLSESSADGEEKQNREAAL